MGIEEYLVDKKPLENVTFLAEGDWESAPEIGIIGGTKIEPKTLTDTQIRWLTLDIQGYVKGGQTDYNTGTGFFLGYSGTAYKLSIGDASANYVTFDGTTLAVGGAITATSGAIGGFDIGADYIRDVANSFGLASTVTVGDDVRFWAGSTFANRATAPARITEAGVATFTSGAIGGWTIAATTLTGGSVELSSTGTITMPTSNTLPPSDSSLRWVTGATLRAWQWAYDSGVAGENKTLGWTIRRYDDTETTSHQWRILNAAGTTVGQMDFYVDGSANCLLTTRAAIYPGTGTATQAVRYISDNGANLVVDSVVVATHAHTGGAGGAVLWSSIDKTTSSIADITTRSHTALTDIGTNTHAQIDTHIAGTLAQHAATTSLQLAGVISDEVGSGSLVFNVSPVLQTPQIHDTTQDHQYVFAVNELTADRTVTLPLLTGDDTFVFASHAETLANKTLTTPTIAATGWTNANHAHAATNSGGQVAISSLSGTISTTQHGSLGTITNAHAWADINKATSSLADITTRSAGDLSSGNLAVARMPVSGNWAITDVAYVSGANFGFGATPSARVHVTDTTAGDNTIALFTGGAARSAGFRNFACGSDADRVGLLLPTGTGDYRIWVGNDGNLRIMTGGDPTSANDGTIVGTQS